MIKVGVIGLGMVGQLHLGAWAAARGAAVRMVADTDPRRASGDLSGAWSNIEGGATAPNLAKIRSTADPLELVHSDEVEVVDICVPTPFHLDLALAAIAAGKHVLCEKPMARSAAEARRLARAAAKAQGLFMPAMCIRFWPQWAWLKRTVQQGTCGSVISASFRRIGAMPPGWFARGELSGGALLDMHLHDTDFIHYVFGPPRAVTSGGWIGPSGCVDHVHTRYLYDDGPVVTAEGSWAASPAMPFDMSFRVLFENATADYRLDRPEAPLLLYRKPDSRGRVPHPTAVKCPAGDGYRAEAAYFAQCIRRATPPAVVTAAEAAESIRTVEAEARSALTGKTVRL